MRQSFLLLATLILPICAANSQDLTAVLKTGDFVNGRWWRLLPDLGKAAYLTAALESVLDLPETTDANCPCILNVVTTAAAKLFVENATPAEVIAVMNAFYAEPANLRIPVLGVLRYAVMKITGTSKAALEACEADLRRNATEPFPHTSCSQH